MKNKLIRIAILLFIWYILTLIYPSVIIPTFKQILVKIVYIFTTKLTIINILITIKRLFIGFFLGILFGFITTFLMIKFKSILEIFYPLVKMLQVVPPISWLILAILWFGLTGKPSIFIVFLSVYSIMTVALTESMLKLDKDLIELAQVFKLSKYDKMRYVILPYLYNSFKSAFIISLGLATKMIVMGELLTTNTGIGAMISDARINIETDSVVAWTIVIIFIYYILEGIFLWILRLKILRRFWFYKISLKSIKRK